jgi:hypothetical protein
MSGVFETSLRSASVSDVDDRRRSLHRGCCGRTHGHGVVKERPSIQHPKAGRSCSHEGVSRGGYESSDEATSVATCPTPDLIMARAAAGRSQSSDVGHPGSPLVKPRSHSSSAASVAQRLYTSTTVSNSAKKTRASRAASDGRAMATEAARAGLSQGNSVGSLKKGGKPRPSMHHEGDSGHFSSAEDGSEPQAGGGSHRTRIQFVLQHDQAPPEQRRRTLITGASDDELPAIDVLRRRQRRERREQLQRRYSPRSLSGGNAASTTIGTPRVGPVRVSSPSPTKGKRMVGRGRRSSEEDPYLSEDGGASSTSPPTTPSPMPPRSTSGRLFKPFAATASSYQQPTSGSAAAAARRAASAGQRRSGPISYAFGSSVSRFHNPLNKTFSDASSVSADDPPSSPRSLSSGGSLHRRSAKQRAGVEEAWLRFKEDVDAAMTRKPGGSGGLYKDLSDMMHTKMEMLDDLEVGQDSGHRFTIPKKGRQRPLDILLQCARGQKALLASEINLGQIEKIVRETRSLSFHFLSLATI